MGKQRRKEESKLMVGNRAPETDNEALKKKVYTKVARMF